ncbi:hypothetical protein [Corallococcus macrosporus]|uniref:hypothetical protein n=1 Tax=Corallococcus macrosporus TaxID=35 RepID=UPI001EFC3354|nr:hypothetical protein [Corallococcus macrosporus]
MEKPDTDVLFARDRVCQERSANVERQAQAMEELPQAAFRRFPVLWGEVTRTRTHLVPELVRPCITPSGKPLLCVLVNLAFG